MGIVSCPSLRVSGGYPPGAALGRCLRISNYFTTASQWRACYTGTLRTYPLVGAILKLQQSHQIHVSSIREIAE